MSEEIVIKLEEEGQTAALEQADAVVETAVEGAVAIVEVAAALAEQINDGDDDLLYEILARFDEVFARVDSLTQLVETVSIKIDSLTALEVAEIVVDTPPQAIEEIAAVAEVIETTNEVPPELPSEPELRKTNKRKWV